MLLPQEQMPLASALSKDPNNQLQGPEESYHRQAQQIRAGGGYSIV